jgi:hypothetical protein
MILLGGLPSSCPLSDAFGVLVLTDKLEASVLPLALVRWQIDLPSHTPHCFSRKKTLFSKVIKMAINAWNSSPWLTVISSLAD